jgi:hypothetical protein
LLLTGPLTDADGSGDLTGGADELAETLTAGRVTDRDAVGR